MGCAARRWEAVAQRLPHDENGAVALLVACRARRPSRNSLILTPSSFDEGSAGAAWICPSFPPRQRVCRNACPYFGSTLYAILALTRLTARLENETLSRMMTLHVKDSVDATAVILLLLPSLPRHLQHDNALRQR